MNLWKIGCVITVGGMMASAAWAQMPGQPVQQGGHIAMPMVLPAGHPDLSAPSPSTQPVSSGALVVRAVQKTQGGPVVGNASVSVELYLHRQHKVIKKIDGRLDEQGILVIEDLPLLLPFQPLVKVVYEGVEYTAAGKLMDAAHPTQQVDVAVYEATEQAPEWRVHMRHVMTEPVADGVKVMEMLAVENPSDRAWIGAVQPDGKRATISLPLPPGIRDLQVGGDLHDCCTLTQNGRLINTMPVPPGMMKVQYSYVVPAVEGRVELKITAPAPVRQMLVFAAGDGRGAKAEGLEAAGNHEMGQTKAQMFRGSDLKAGHEATVTLTMAAAQAAAVPVASSSVVPKVIAGIGGTLILAIGTAIVLLKPKGANLK